MRSCSCMETCVRANETPVACLRHGSSGTRHLRQAPSLACFFRSHHHQRRSWRILDTHPVQTHFPAGRRPVTRMANARAHSSSHTEGKKTYSPKAPRARDGLPAKFDKSIRARFRHPEPTALRPLGLRRLVSQAPRIFPITLITCSTVNPKSISVFPHPNPNNVDHVSGIGPSSAS